MISVANVTDRRRKEAEQSQAVIDTLLSGVNGPIIRRFVEDQTGPQAEAIRQALGGDYKAAEAILAKIKKSSPA